MRICSVLVLSAALLACKGAPVQEMSDARQAIEAARAAGAQERSPRELRDAQAAITRAESSLREQHYTRARFAAQEAKRNAAVALAKSHDAGADRVPDVMPVSQ